MALIERIKYEGNEYPLRWVFIKTFGLMPISTTDLSNKLITEEGGYFSEEALSVDEAIFFYVEPSQISLPERKLSTLISSDL